MSKLQRAEALPVAVIGFFPAIGGNNVRGTRCLSEGNNGREFIRAIVTAAAQHEVDGQKRFALAFDTGDEVLASLQEFAARERLSAAQVSAIAAFSSAILGYFAPALAAAEVGIAPWEPAPT